MGARLDHTAHDHRDDVARSRLLPSALRDARPAFGVACLLILALTRKRDRYPAPSHHCAGAFPESAGFFAHSNQSAFAQIPSLSSYAPASKDLPPAQPEGGQAP